MNTHEVTRESYVSSTRTQLSQAAKKRETAATSENKDPDFNLDFDPKMIDNLKPLLKNLIFRWWSI